MLRRAPSRAVVCGVRSGWLALSVWTAGRLICLLCEGGGEKIHWQLKFIEVCGCNLEGKV